MWINLGEVILINELKYGPRQKKLSKKFNNVGSLDENNLKNITATNCSSVRSRNPVSPSSSLSHSWIFSLVVSVSS
jgi:hypothetical protein